MSQDIQELVWTSELVKKFWNYEAQYVENYFTYQYGKSIVQTLSPWLKNAVSILDYGCGTGYLMPHLLKLNKKVCGTDSSDDSLRIVKTRHKGEPNFGGAFTLEEIASKHLRFDCVTLIEVVEHLYDEQLNEMIQNLRSTLKDGGLVLISTPNDEDLEKSKVYCPVSGVVFHRWQHVRSWSASTLTSFMTEQGFEPVSCFATDLRVDRFKPWDRTFIKHVFRKAKGSKMPHLVGVFRKSKISRDN